MTGLLAGVGAVAVPLTLLVAVAGQAARPGALAAALLTHRVVPAPLIAPVAALAVLAEAAAGGGALAGLVTGNAALLRSGLALAAVLLAGYALYGAQVARTRGRVPCGCAGSSTPMTGWVAGRAAALAALAAAGALWGPAAGTTGAGRAVTVLAGVAFAALLWALPQALTVPFDGERSVAR
ncbi:hypothetical protein GCM10009678_30830 [Actinomadura kijaniata]|uniref:Methylamine utilisation protein MauE domain-containing protein n=1 Tax=Actinomadura namibiensis TaxID=182080 RepID=A0A7W3LPL6_ACTNM|nr:MauE/DoxX family redox-associated membrane protein [Actinomadura namibiensis]MBA8951950.1 hypothetical protein [Actinomadura namibiensis]